MPALAVIVVGTFAGHAAWGPNGILAGGSYHRVLQQRQVELAQIEQELCAASDRSQLLDLCKADPDMADELVRKDLGLVRPDEVIIPARLILPGTGRWQPKADGGVDPSTIRLRCVVPLRVPGRNGCRPPKRCL